MTFTVTLLWALLTDHAWVLPDLGCPWDTWHSLGPPVQLLQWLPLSCCFMDSVEDEMLVASATQGECITQKDSSPPLQTAGEAQESVCSLGAPGTRIHVGRTPPYLSHLERAHVPSLVESGISYGWWQARSHV